MAVAGVLLARTATAQTSVHGSGSASVGYTDNIANAPDEPTLNLPPKVGDAFVSVTPGLLLVHESERVELIASYYRPATFFLTNPGNEVSADNGSVAAQIALTETDTLLLGLIGSRTTTRALSLGQPQDSQANSLTAEPLSFFSIGVTEQWSHAFDDRWSTSQNLGVATIIPIDSEQAMRADLTLGLGSTYRFGSNALELQGVLTAAFLPGSGDVSDPVQQQDRTPLLASSTLGFRRDLNEVWSISTQFGALTAYDPELGTNYAGLIWGASLSMTLEEGYLASLSYQRSVAPSLLTGLTTRSDSGSLQGTIPLSRDNFVGVLSSVGIAANAQVAVDDSFTTPFNTFVADVGVGWFPPAHPSLLLRYSHLSQLGVDENVFAIANFSTNQVMLTVAWTLPTRDQLPTIVTPKRRVDQGDRDKDGDPIE